MKKTMILSLALCAIMPVSSMTTLAAERKPMLIPQVLTVNEAIRLPLRAVAEKIGHMADQEYSDDTLIISVATDVAEADIMHLFQSNGLEIIDKMDNFKMYTVKLEKPMTAGKLDAMITELEKNEEILAVNKNYIMQVDTDR